MSSLVLATIVVEGCNRDAPLAELRRAHVTRLVVPRLSLDVDYRVCAVDASAESHAIPHPRCAADSVRSAPPARILDVVLRAPSSPTVGGVEVGALHETALVDLLWPDDAGISLRRSISYLRTVARLSDDPAPALADLSAAYLVRAERAQSPRDLLEAVEAATRALALDPRSASARFNLALALDYLGLDDQAMRAWRRYLEMDSTSGWAGEARSYASALSARQRRAFPPSIGAADSVVDAFVERDPQEARIFGWNELLGGWGGATTKGRSARADSLLHVTRVLAASLERRGRDATLADAVAAIDARDEGDAMRRSLALAHREYAAGQVAYQSAEYAASELAFERVLAQAPSSAALRQWASLFLGATLVYRGERARGERMIRDVVARADTLRHPALAGRARWMLGTTMLRSGRASGAAVVRGANSLFARAGERENLGAVEFVEGEADFDVADPERGYVETHRALITLRGYGASIWHHNALFVLARAAVADGLLHAALRVQDEGVAVAERTGLPFYAVEARLSRARVLGAAGDTAPADRDIAAASAVVARLPAGAAREWFQADLRLTEFVGLRGRTIPSRQALDSVVHFFRKASNPVRLLPALLARTDAWLAARRVDSATADLREAVALLERRDADVQDADLRVALLDAARSVFDRLALLELDAGRPAAALDYLERGRASLASIAPSSSLDRNRRMTMPRGSVGLAYALVGDTMIVWTVSDGAVHASRTVLDHARFIQRVERVTSSLELGAAGSASAASLQSDLAALYDRLVRPVESQLGDDEATLVVSVDGEIAGVPFAAMYDSVRRRYLVESHPLRFVPSLRDATAPKPASPVRSALLVGEPALDRDIFPDLGPLRGAAEEVGVVAADYVRPVVLAGAEADRSRVEAQLPRAGVVHFAGHAVFDDERPERSFLAVAGIPGRLTATDVASLDLRRVRLVVLSACETMRAHGGRSGGFAGLTGAVLSAGAGGVVGSLWRVSDARTLELMRDFHHAYHTSGDAARALRDAQLRQIHSPDPRRAAPAAWSGFRYAGH